MSLSKFFQSREEEPSINLSPMIDMVFLLLLFFIVTTTFDRNEAIVVNRSKAESVAPLEREKRKVLLDSTGHYWLEDSAWTLEDLLTEIEAWSQNNEKGILLLVPDRAGKMDPFVQLIDGLNLRGITRFAIAADKKSKAAKK